MLLSMERAQQGEKLKPSSRAVLPTELAPGDNLPFHLSEESKKLLQEKVEKNMQRHEEDGTPYVEAVSPTQ